MQPAHLIAARVRDGSLSPVDAVEQALARIDALEPLLHAWVEVDRDGALGQAKDLAAALSRGEPLGPLAGVPVGIKDIVDVAGLPTRAGAPPFAHYTPTSDAAVVARLRRAGAVIVGKTHTTQFAYLDPAPTCNPWNREHTPGGSSSGSAAAVAAGMLPLAIGSQTVGSVLRPAAYCGVVGFKPSLGRISYAGTLPLASSFDHIGLLCSCVADAALGLSVVAGYDAADPYSVEAPVDDYVASLANPAPPRLGLPRAYYAGTASAEVAAHLEDAVRRFEIAGAEVVEVTFPATAPEIADAAQPVMRYEAAVAHSQRYAAHKAEYGASIRGLIEAGLSTSPEDYRNARDAMRRLRDSLSDALTQVDALLLPVAPATAPSGLNTTGPGIFCGPASFTGLPSIAVPSGVSPSGLPLSLQLIGASLGEARLLRVAAWVERVLDFNARPELPER
jgi:Asp-tRNA(Asn)/Glu-tRNA(Gln) amidotransferase A subunit family amidase